MTNGKADRAQATAVDPLLPFWRAAHAATHVGIRLCEGCPFCYPARNGSSANPQQDTENP